MIELLALAGVVVAFLGLRGPGRGAAPASSAPRPAGGSSAFKQAFYAAAMSVDLLGIPVDLLWPIADDETADGTNSVNVTNNPGSIHATPEWTGPTHTTARGEVLRVYPRLADGIAAMAREIANSAHFRTAYGYARANMPWQFYQALASGDQGDGWVGNDAAKQASYASALMRIYQRGA